MNSLGVLRPGDRVDILLTLDLSKALIPPAGAASNPAARTNANGTVDQAGAPTGSELSTQVTLQDVQILSIGPPASNLPTTNAPNQPQAQGQAQPPPPQPTSKVITFLLDHQDAVTLKYIKDSGGTMDLVVRSPDDKQLAKTDAVTLDSLYRKYGFRFVQPVNP
jgi:Flp pilus assembly protein CpaB